MVRIGYIVPGTGLDSTEIKRREKVANDILRGTSKVDIIQTENGPKYIDNAIDETYASFSYLPQLKKLENEYDSFVIGCFGDPGLRAARQLIRTPVIGPAQSSIHFTAQVADRYIIVEPNEEQISEERELSRRYAMDNHLAGVVAVETPVKEIVRNRDAALKKIKNTISLAIKKYDGEAVILGCMSMGYHLLDEILTDQLKIPVINPVKISLKMAELQGSLKIRHSIKSYPNVVYNF